MALGVGLLIASTVGCGKDHGDYYYVADIEGQGDTLLIKFLYTCGRIDITWNGAFVGDKPIRGVLTVRHDNGGDDCDYDRRIESFDVGPMKRAFREQHQEPTPLGVRIDPFEMEQGSTCLDDLFQDTPFQSSICN